MVAAKGYTAVVYLLKSLNGNRRLAAPAAPRRPAGDGALHVHPVRLPGRVGRLDGRAARPLGRLLDLCDALPLLPLADRRVRRVPGAQGRGRGAVEAREAGLGVEDMAAIGYGLDELLDASCTHAELRETGKFAKEDGVGLPWEGHTDFVWSVCWLGGQTLASGSDDKSIKVWDVGAGTCMTTLTGHTGYVWSVCWLSATAVASRDRERG